MTFTLPHIIYGTVTNGGTLRLTIKNDTTGDTQIVVTDINGRYVADAGNFTSGYTEGDTIKLIIDELPQYTDNITTDNNDIRLI